MDPRKCFDKCYMSVYTLTSDAPTMVNKKDKLDEMKQCACEQPCLCFNLRRASRVVTSLYDETFRALGLRTGQLAIIDMAAKVGPATICQLAEATATDRTTLTRNLRPLEREGFVKVINGSADRREREVVITQKGKAVLEEAFPMWQKIQEKIKGTLGRTRAERLIRELCCAVNEIEMI